MQGIFIHDERPPSKAAIRRAVESGFTEYIYVESTSVFGDEWSGTLDTLPEGARITFVGPDPYTSRKFYGTIARKGGKLKVA